MTEQVPIIAVVEAGIRKGLRPGELFDAVKELSLTNSLEAARGIAEVLPRIKPAGEHEAILLAEMTAIIQIALPVMEREGVKSLAKALAYAAKDGDPQARRVMRALAEAMARDFITIGGEENAAGGAPRRQRREKIG